MYTHVERLPHVFQDAGPTAQSQIVRQAGWTATFCNASRNPGLRRADSEHSVFLTAWRHLCMAMLRRVCVRSIMPEFVNLYLVPLS